MQRTKITRIWKLIPAINQPLTETRRACRAATKMLIQFKGMTPGGRCSKLKSRHDAYKQWDMTNRYKSLIRQDSIQLTTH